VNGRRLLAGVVVASVLATVLSLTWTVVLAPLRSGGPAAPQASRAPGPGAQAVAAEPAGPEWSTAWANAPASAHKANPGGFPGFTFRNVVHTTIGGPRVRIRLTNRFGPAPIKFGHVTVAISAHAGGRRDGTNDPSDGSAVPGTMREVSFAGRTEVVVAQGADALSDPIDLEVPADADLLISVWTPAPAGRATYHPDAKQVSFISRGPQDRTSDVGATEFTLRTPYWWYVTAVEVTGAPGTIVALGDSITDGGASTEGANRRWPDYLAGRLAASPDPDYGVVNSGISGNRLLLDASFPRTKVYSIAGKSALTRFADDVLDRSGVRTVIILIGINDIIQTPQQADPVQITTGLSQVAARARAHGLRVVGATITPWKGWPGYTPKIDQVRLTVNEWIRAGGDGAFDAVADMDQATRDPADPAQLRREYHGGDYLHPNDAGLRAMANSIPLDRL
jgi:lysophospholipase L1-like esterase